MSCFIFKERTYNYVFNESSTTYRCIQGQHSADFVPPVDMSSHACGLHQEPLRQEHNVLENKTLVQCWCDTSLRLRHCAKN